MRVGITSSIVIVYRVCNSRGRKSILRIFRDLAGSAYAKSVHDNAYLCLANSSEQAEEQGHVEKLGLRTAFLGRLLFSGSALCLSAICRRTRGPVA